MTPSIPMWDNPNQIITDALAKAKADAKANPYQYKSDLPHCGLCGAIASMGCHNCDYTDMGS